MNTKTKRRLGVVTGLIVIALVLTLAIVGGNSAAHTVSVAEALQVKDSSKIQVTGNVAENSFDINGNTLTFQIFDPQADPGATALLPVRYDGGVAATFGNDVTAICTGKKDGSGTLVCSELVTKCPSKYENASGSLSVGELLSYGSKVTNKPVVLSGSIAAGTLAAVDADERFTLTDPATGSSVPVVYLGAMPDNMVEGARIVLTGSINDAGVFTATNVAFGT